MSVRIYYIMCRRFLFFIFLMMTLGAAGQHPFSLDWRVLKTKNAKVIYPSYLGFDAARIAQGLDRVVRGDTSNIGLLPKRFPIVISAPSNTSNGYTTLSPYKMVLYTRPMDGTSLGSAEWFQTLLTHEYRHIVQYRLFDQGFTRFGHCVMGSMGWSALMFSVPQWFYEGDAVYAETVLSSQGRGRAASFDMSISAIVQDCGRLYPYDKMLHRSYRDMIPNHYPLGYMLVTGARRKYGIDVFNKVARRQSLYSFWPFAFGCGYHYYTGKRLGQSYRAIFSELKDVYSQRSRSLHVVDYQVVNDTNKRMYTSYLSPVVIDGGRVMCVKSSMSKTYRFVVLDSLGREVENLGHTDADGFDTDGEKAVYITEVPDVRWTERNYSDIAVFDIGSRECQIVTDKCKYGSVSLSLDGNRLVAVDFSENRICKLVVLEIRKSNGQYSVRQVKSFYSKPMEYFRCPQFVDDNRIAYISNYDNKNSIRILDLGTMTTGEALGYTSENISEVCPSDDGDTLYYVSDRSGIVNIYRVPSSGGEPSQVTNVRYGVSDIFVHGERIYFCSYSRMGYNIAYCNTSDVVEPHAPAGLNFFAPLLPKEPSASLDVIATEMPDTSLLSKSKKYRQLSDPFRFLGWIPNADGSNYSVTAYTANNLETLYTSVTETYNSDLQYWRTGVAVEYSGFYPVISFTASLGEAADRYMVPTSFTTYAIVPYYWTENIYSANVSLPLNLSRLWYSQGLTFSVGAHCYSIKDKPYHDAIELPSGNMGFLSAGVSYSWSRQKASRDFKSPLSVSLSAGVLGGLRSNPVDASMVSAAASLTVPGFFRQNYFTVNVNAVRQSQVQNQYDVYLFDHSSFDLHGYASARMQSFARVGAEYSFPMGYPDIGIPCVVWIKRFRGALMGELARGTLFRTNYDYLSAGCKLFADVCVFRLNYNITVGYYVAKGLKSNGLDGWERGVLLALPF